GEKRHGLQALALLDELLVQERVVGAADGHRPLAVLEEAHEQAQRGIEHGLLHATLVARLLPGLAGAGEIAERVQQPAVPAVPWIEDLVDRTLLVRIVQVLGDLLLGLGDVAVGVDDVHRFILQLGIASGLMTCAGGSPRPTARICSSASARLARRPASLWPTLWGVRISRSGSAWRHGGSAGSGSLAKASTAAPAIQRSSTARAT